MKTMNHGSKILQNLRTLPGLMGRACTGLLLIVLLVLSVAIQAQQAQNVDQLIAELLASSDPVLVEQGMQLNQFINESNPTLTIYNGEFSIHGGLTPTVLDVHIGSLNYLYTPHLDFENIKLIRIRLQNPGDMNILLQLDDLSHFTNLDYVFFLATFEVCPGNPGNDVCYSTQISNLVAGSDTNNYIVAYKVVMIM